jgi:putative transcriptional regulator
MAGPEVNASVPVRRVASKGCLTGTTGKATFTSMRNRVREQRAQRGLSQAELAAALGVSRQTVISIENGRYLPSLPLAFTIARFFDLTVDKMFDPEDEEAGS